MKSMLPFFLCAMLFTMAHAAPEATPPQQKARTISVSGCAVGHIQSDAVQWTVTRESTGKNMAEAKEGCELQMKTLVDALNKKGIQGADVWLGMSKIQDALAGQENAAVEVPKRFTVTRTVTFRQKELHLFQEILDLLNKGTGKVAYKMYCAKVDAITKDTLVRATQAAKEKAAAMAGVLGSTLGPVLTINEYAPKDFAIKDEDVVIDSNTPVLGAEAQKICITVYVTFELL